MWEIIFIHNLNKPPIGNGKHENCNERFNFKTDENEGLEQKGTHGLRQRKYF